MGGGRGQRQGGAACSVAAGPQDCSQAGLSGAVSAHCHSVNVHLQDHVWKLHVCCKAEAAPSSGPKVNAPQAHSHCC